MTERLFESDSSPVATVLTPRGRGAIAEIRFSGDCRLMGDAATGCFRAANGKPLAEQPVNRVVFGRWGRADPAEDVVVCRIDESTVEIGCHGGDAAVNRILGDLESLGCTVESWCETEERAGRLHAECIQALAAATTLRTADILLQQSGILHDEMEGILRLVEPQSKYKGQSTKYEVQQHIISDAQEFRTLYFVLRTSLLDRIDSLLKWYSFGRHLTRPWDVVLAGPPNVGKSSLINALLGYSRSIVYDQPGTTRDVVTAETAFDGWPIRLIDTAGLRGEAGGLESAGIELTRQRLASADCRVLLFDSSQPLQESDRLLTAEWPEAILVSHKCDLPSHPGNEVQPGALRVSSLTGEGVDQLAKTLIERLIPSVPPPLTPIPFTERQCALLREARGTEPSGARSSASRG